MEIIVTAVFIILVAFLIYKNYEILFIKKHMYDGEISISKVTLLSIFIYFSLFFSIIRDFISLCWNVEYSFSSEFLYGILCYLLLVYFAIFIFIKYNLSDLISRFIASFIVSFFLSVLILWAFSNIVHEFRPLDSLKRYALIYTEEETNDDEDNILTKSIPKYIINKESFFEDSIISEYKIIKIFSEDNVIKVLNSEGGEEYLKYEFCFTKQYGKYRNYKLLNIYENVIEKWFYGGFLYVLEVIYGSWMIILSNILLLYSDFKFHLFTKDFEQSPYDKYGL